MLGMVLPLLQRLSTQHLVHLLLVSPPSFWTKRDFLEQDITLVFFWLWMDLWQVIFLKKRWFDYDTIFFIYFFHKGTVALCAGCNVYPTWAAFMVGAIAGPIFLFFNWLLLRLKVSKKLKIGFFFKTYLATYFDTNNMHRLMTRWMPFRFMVQVDFGALWPFISLRMMVSF